MALYESWWLTEISQSLDLNTHFRLTDSQMLLHNVKQHNVNVTERNVTKRSCTQRKSSKT